MEGGSHRFFPFQLREQRICYLRLQSEIRTVTRQQSVAAIATSKSNFSQLPCLNSAFLLFVVLGIIPTSHPVTLKAHHELRPIFQTATYSECHAVASCHSCVDTHTVPTSVNRYRYIYVG